MSMTTLSQQAFEVASGGLSLSLLHLCFVGFLFAGLLWWVSWAFVDVWQGWASEKIRNAAIGRFAVKALLLVVFSFWMFGS